MARALHRADTRTQQDEGVMIHSIGGNVDVRACCGGEVIECKVNAVVSGFLPLARPPILGGNNGLRFGHDLAGHTLSRE